LFSKPKKLVDSVIANAGSSIPLNDCVAQHILGVIFLVLARISYWTFKPGKREEAFAELDRILNNLTKTCVGFRGYISLLSYDHPDELSILTVWEDEDALSKSERDALAVAIQKVNAQLKNPPCIEKYRVYSTELLNSEA
jgi:heme-degrading monooxygenase HmoA